MFKFIWNSCTRSQRKHFNNKRIFAIKTTTILGNYTNDIQHVISELKYPKNHDFGAKAGGFNVLNVPDDWYKSPDQFWREYNKPFLDQAIARNDVISMATNPLKDLSLLVKPDGTLTGFGKEYKYLTSHGYQYDKATSTMIKK